MGNKVRFTMKNSPVGLSQVNCVVLDINYSKLWSGVKTVAGNAVELDIGTAGTSGQNVWVYGNNATAGTESTASPFGGYSVVENEPSPPDPVGPFYALKNSSYNYAQLDSPVTLPEDGILSFYMIPNDTAVSEYAIRSSSGAACVNYRHSDGRFRVCTDDGRLFTFALTSLIVGEQAYIVVRLIDNGCQLYVNGVLHEELTGVHTTMTIDQIGEGVNTYGVTIGNLVSYPMVVDVVGEVNAIDTIGNNNITYIDLTSPLTINEYNEVTIDY